MYSKLSNNTERYSILIYYVPNNTAVNNIKLQEAEFQEEIDKSSGVARDFIHNFQKLIDQAQACVHTNTHTHRSSRIKGLNNTICRNANTQKYICMNFYIRPLFSSKHIWNICKNRQ